MRAAVLHEVNQPMTIETLEVAMPQAHEVLLRTGHAGLCHSDLHFIEGLYPMPKPWSLGTSRRRLLRQWVARSAT